MKTTAIEIDGVRYEPAKHKGEIRCGNCDLFKFCSKSNFCYACEFSVGRPFVFKRVKQQSK